MTRFATKEDEWRAYLTGTHPTLRWGHRIFRFVPYGPRCKMCSAPFSGPGRLLLGHRGFAQWEKHPEICTRCINLLGDQDVSGAEVEISFLFADVRRSSDLARRVGTMEFTRLMQRFYATARTVLLANDAIVDKFVGDEVVGFFLPMLTGPNHAGAAVRTAQELGELCPSCGAESASLQGRSVDGRTVRELLCIACRYVWPAPAHLAPLSPLPARRSARGYGCRFGGIVRS